MTRLSRWLCRLMLGSLVIACLGSLYGCPLLEITVDVPDSDILSGVTLIVSYRVNATMQDNNGTYPTVHETFFEDSYEVYYDPMTRNYYGDDIDVTFNEDFAEITSLDVLAITNTYGIVRTSRQDQVKASQIPKLGKVAEYYFFDTYVVFRSVKPCDVISYLYYDRVQYNEPVFRTAMTSYTCDADSYIDFAIMDPEFGKR